MPILYRARFPFYIVGLAVSLLLIVGTACGGDDDEGGGATATPGDGSPAADLTGETVDALGIWGEEEIDDFDAMVAPWKA